MISMGAKVGASDFGVSNADPPDLAAERMKARFAAMETT